MYLRALAPIDLTDAAAPLAAESVRCRQVLLQSDPGDPDGTDANVGTVFFGDGDQQPNKLHAGDSIIVPCEDLAQLYVKSSQAGDRLLVSYWVEGGL